MSDLGQEDVSSICCEHRSVARVGLLIGFRAQVLSIIIMLSISIMLSIIIIINSIILILIIITMVPLSLHLLGGKEPTRKKHPVCHMYFFHHQIRLS